MSGAAEANAPTAKIIDTSSTSETPSHAAPRPGAHLEEDDEFEDFPVEDWTKDEEMSSVQTTGGPGGNSSSSNGPTTTSHLWEESWDDDDTTDDFSLQLKEELKKMDAQRKS